MSSSHFHGSNAKGVTVLIWDYPWDIRPGSVMFRDLPSRFRRLDFSVDFQHVQKFHFFRSRPLVNVGNRRYPQTPGRNRSLSVAYPYVVRGLKLVTVYHGTHRTDYGYAAVEHFLKELWRYSHSSYSRLHHRRKVTTVAKRRQFSRRIISD